MGVQKNTATRIKGMGRQMGQGFNFQPSEDNSQLFVISSSRVPTHFLDSAGIGFLYTFKKTEIKTKWPDIGLYKIKAKLVIARVGR